MAGVKYSRLNQMDENGKQQQAFNFTSAFDYNQEGEGDFDSKHDYNSAFRYRDPNGKSSVRIRMTDERAMATDFERAPADVFLFLTSWFLTFFSYFFFIATAPLSYWFIVKNLGEFDRYVVFRLGKMVGVKGPGRIIVFPWIDRTTKIDVRATAFAVPPNQFITADGGIVEMGAEIQYGILDVITMVREVVDHQEILRSLGRTLLVKMLTKKTVNQLKRDRKIAAQEIQDEMNDQVRRWGINVQDVVLSDAKVLKQPENASTTAVGSIMKGLGVKDEPKYPTPREFVSTTFGLSENEGRPQETVSALNPAMFGGGGGPISGTPSMNMDLLHSLATGGGGAMNHGPGIVAPPSLPRVEENPSNWGKCLEVIINTEFSGLLEEDAFGLFKLEITETENGVDTYFIHLSATQREVTEVNPTGRQPDVSVRLTGSDLGNILDGSLAPLQAYLTGRISAHGDVKKLMFFDKLSKRGHKAGSMFNI